MSCPTNEKFIEIVFLYKLLNHYTNWNSLTSFIDRETMKWNYGVIEKFRLKMFGESFNQNVTTKKKNIDYIMNLRLFGRPFLLFLLSDSLVIGDVSNIYELPIKSQEMNFCLMHLGEYTQLLNVIEISYSLVCVVVPTFNWRLCNFLQGSRHWRTRKRSFK